MKKIAVTVALVAALVAISSVVAHADVKDSWITTKSTIVLLTMDGFSVNGANVDTINGKVTIHGKVATAADRTKAEQTVRGVDGVKSVKNLLQIVPGSKREVVERADADVKDAVQAAFKANGRVKDSGISVASVNKGVVLLAGKAKSLESHLEAVQLAFTVKGVRRVASEVQVDAGT